MRKIPVEIENNFDNILIDIGDKLSPIFYKMNFTANTLTGISGVLGIISIYFYIKKLYFLSAIFFLLSYMFDCFDGFYARKYNMVTNFGDIFDHIKDYFIGIILFSLLFYKYWQTSTWYRYLPFIIIILYIIGSIHVGCQELYYNTNKGSNMLSIYKKLCPKFDNNQQLYNYMKRTKYFGIGTTTLYGIFLILFSRYIK